MDYSATAFEILRKLFASVFNWICKRKKQFGGLVRRYSNPNEMRVINSRRFQPTVSVLEFDAGQHPSFDAYPDVYRRLKPTAIYNAGRCPALRYI